MHKMAQYIIPLLFVLTITVTLILQYQDRANNTVNLNTCGMTKCVWEVTSVKG